MQFKMKIGAVALSVLMLSACDHDDNDTSAFSTDYAAIVLTNLHGNDASSDIEIINLHDEDLVATANFSPSDKSDFSVDAYGQHFYKLGRFGIDTVSKFNPLDPTLAVFSDYSTKMNANDDSVNPYQLIFVSETKAYLLRYNDAAIWIVNPSAETEDAFKIGEIDLSAYADSDGSPEAASAVLVGDELYVLLQRLEWFATGATAFVAVIDTTTDTEKEMSLDDTLKGIPLKVHNPGVIAYQADVGLLVQAVGDYGCEEGSSWCEARPVGYDGGIEAINMTDFSTAIIVDDGDIDNHPYDQISNLAIVDANTAYFVAYASWGSSSVYRFNPTTGVVADATVTELANIDIRLIKTGPEGLLWVGVADVNPYISLIDPADDTLVATIQTNQNPASLAFVVPPKESEQ